MESLVKIGGANTVTECRKEQSIDNAIGMFLAECDIRENSRVVYRRGLQCFFKWVAASGRMIDELSRADIIAYKETLLDTHSNLTVLGYLVALRRFYEWAEGNKFYLNIAKGIKSPKRKNAYLKEHLRESRFTNCSIILRTMHVTMPS